MIVVWTRVPRVKMSRGFEYSAAYGLVRAASALTLEMEVSEGSPFFESDYLLPLGRGDQTFR